LKKLVFIIIALISMLPSTSNATLITPSAITSTGGFNNDVALINDGIIPAESSVWSANTNVWWDSAFAPTFTLDFGELYNINDVLVSVDNNDDYEVTWSLDSVSWSNLFTINRSYGEITWGMDTFSTDTLHNEYIAAIDFSTVQARYLRIKVTGGDFGLSIGEFQAFGSKLTTSVPEPSSLAIFALGFIGLIIRSVKKRS
jgi:hypothetical protein